MTATPYDQETDATTFENDPDVPETKAVAPRASTPAPAVLADWQAAIDKCTWVGAEDDESTLLGIYAQILAAEDEKAVGAGLEGRSITKLGLANVPLIVRDFALAPSDYDTILGCYAVVEATNALTGEQIVFAAGGKLVVQLVRWAELEALPVNAKVIEIPSRKAGRNPALSFVLI